MTSAIALGGAMAIFCSPALGGLSFSPLPFFTGANSSRAYDVSNAGSVVVGQSGGLAVSWSSGGAAAQLPALPDAASDSFTRAVAVSADGSTIIGSTTTYAGPGTEAIHLTRWQGGTASVMSQPALADPFMVRGGVSDTGQHAAAHVLAQGSLTFAMRWNGTAHSLINGPDESTANASRSYDISGDGSVVVGEANYLDSSDVSHHYGFRWSAGTGMLALPWSASNGHAIPFGASGDGSVLVGQLETATTAFILNWGGSVTSLGDLSGGSTWSKATGVSGDGSTVIGLGTSASGVEPFIWTNNTGMVSLRTLLGSAVGAGWQLHSTSANIDPRISPDGLWISGTGINPSGQVQGWLVQVPTPSVLVLGLAWALRPGRGRR